MLNCFFCVSIPLEQGSVLRHITAFNFEASSEVSIPLEQGSVLRLQVPPNGVSVDIVSIPLEQGSVLRPTVYYQKGVLTTSQSLWNRAVSYDDIYIFIYLSLARSQSLWNRAVSYDFNIN